MARAKNGESREEELKQVIEEAFTDRGLEGEDIKICCLPSDGRLRSLILELSIDGRLDDQDGRGVNPKWKKYIGDHANKMLNALLGAIRRFRASHKDCPTVKVSASYTNFGVRRHRQDYV
jgi:hypothetical protein